MVDDFKKPVFQTQKGRCTDETYRDCGLVHKFQPGLVPASRKGNGHGLSLLTKQLPRVNTCGNGELVLSNGVSLRPLSTFQGRHFVLE